MKTIRTKRQTLRYLSWFAIGMALEHAPLTKALAQDAAGATPPAPDAENAWSVAHTSNFKAIYGTPALRDAFFLFLKNVYNLFPEDRFHQLIDEATRNGATDKEIYQRVQGQLDTIEPFLANVRYALPALARQKAEMSEQTLTLLGAKRKINGYMEIGSTGRYIGKLDSSLELSGDVVLLHSAAPSYSPVDIVERGQLTKLGRFVSLNDYAPISPNSIADASLDVVGNYIGFHHSPVTKRDAFVKSIHRVLRPGGRLILRDHDVVSTEMNHMVALAHDVFNLGLNIDWTVNQREIRNFTSVNEISEYLVRWGFVPSKTHQPLLQPGDPTHNALMEFIKA